MSLASQNGIISSCQFNTQRMTVTLWNSTYPVGKQTSVDDELLLLLTPETLAFLPPSMQIDGTAENVREWVKAREAESSLLAVQDRQTGTLLGLLILTESLEAEGIEIRLGYLFAQHQWGKGYATELLTGLLDWCLKQEKSMRLVGGVENNNLASIRVLTKAGFKKAPNSAGIFLREIHY